MGYTLAIGEFKVTVEDEGLNSYLYYSVEEVKAFPDTPFFDEYTKSNYKSPSYTAWSESMKAAGLTDFMYNLETGLIREHPGIVPLTKEHQKIINNAFNNFDKKLHNYYIYQRINWLNYWTNWALKNCKLPVFYNS